MPLTQCLLTSDPTRATGRVFTWCFSLPHGVCVVGLQLRISCRLYNPHRDTLRVPVDFYYTFLLYHLPRDPPSGLSSSHPSLRSSCSSNRLQRILPNHPLRLRCNPSRSSCPLEKE